MLKPKEQAAAAERFALRWQGRGRERSETQTFWLELLRDVFGVEDAGRFAEFEKPVSLSHTSFIDVWLPQTRVVIEQKGLTKDLQKPIPQSDGTLLKPEQQALRYAHAMPWSERPRWVVACNFRQFLVFDQEHPHDPGQLIELRDLGKEFYRLGFLCSTASERTRREEEVSLQAGEIIGRIYDGLLKQYKAPSPKQTAPSPPRPPHEGGSLDAGNAEAGVTQVVKGSAPPSWGGAEGAVPLNVLCVRLVFCLYAEDAGIFRRDQFHDYLERYRAADLREELLQLFRTLDTPEAERSPYLREELRAFPYVNGGLFREPTDIPQITHTLRSLLLEDAAQHFDWRQISPTIFGAVFESTLNPLTRRAGGMHYTSIANIHRLIDPLFLDDLTAELEALLEEPEGKARQQHLLSYQDKLASLRFLDPACGSGNFLTETYLSLRRLENRMLRAYYHGQAALGEFLDPVKVSIGQFYGIEINDFAVTVAATALWISEDQMLDETRGIVNFQGSILPLKSYHNIREGNALRMDWADVLPPESCSYIIGNPPFIGANQMNDAQRDDLRYVFGEKWKNLGEMDYVSAWYKKASDYMKGTSIQAALVSTNSITQGEQVSNLWKPLLAEGLHINFAWRTFRWDSEATSKAHVHCVIVGFGFGNSSAHKYIYDEGKKEEAANINPYLLDAPDVLISSRPKPLCNVPPIRKGNQPTDGGNLIIEPEELEEFLKQEPKAKPYIKRLIGAKEYINNKPRYCLWLVGIQPHELRSMPHVMERVNKVREMRLASSAPGTWKLADTPWLFRETNNPATYIVVPSTSSERRRYIPMGFLDSNTIPTNLVLIIPGATLYHFGVLESNVHMAWMRATCGRLKSDYRYSKDIVYNNFPWPRPTAEQEAEIARTAQGILDARAEFPDASLADLYDETAMPPALRRAHQENDRATMRAYGFPVGASFTEAHCVAALFARYEALTSENHT